MFTCEYVMTRSGDPGLLMCYSILCKSIEDTKAGLQGGSRNQAPRRLVSRNDGTMDRRLIIHNPAQASTPQSIIGRSQDRREPSTEVAMAIVTDADSPDDVDEIAENLIGITLLEIDRVDNTEQSQEEREEQLEALGAIRAVQKKVIKLADETTTAAASAPRWTDKTSGSNITLSGIGVESGRISKDSEAAVSQEDPDATALQQQTDEYPAKQTREPGVTKGAPGSEKGDEVIYFTDTLGSEFEIPYNLVRTWKVSATILLVLPHTC